MKPKVIELEKTCEACPAQWEGQLEDGRMIYIRYRFGWLSIRVSKGVTSDIREAIRGEEILGVEHREELDGEMGFQTLVDLSGGIINYGEIKAE